MAKIKKKAADIWSHYYQEIIIGGTFIGGIVGMIAGIRWIKRMQHELINAIRSLKA